MDRPTLSPEERSSLLAAEQPLRVAREVIDELEELGVDLSAERVQLETQERLRSGILGRFSAKRTRRPAPNQ
ncbi:MAG: hypothetical protein O2816_05035 [Planctomycetota bacterium]|nr:hypothetical protein [Planctomycetota bacterium]